MKKTKAPAKPDGIHAQKPCEPLPVLTRIKLAFLDEYVCEKPGYDPYDTSRSRGPDVWASKRKRA